MAPTPVAILAGVGPGTGGAVAKLFAKKYPVVLLSRSQSTLDPLVSAIQSSGGKALGIPTDVGSESSVKAAFDQATQHFGSGSSLSIAAAVYNAPGKFGRKPFMEQTTAEYREALETGTVAAFVFAQAAMPGLLQHAETTNAQPVKSEADHQHPPTLIFTGATASVKGSALFSSFASSKWALRALAQSLAREFGPQGVHVAHSVIDGVINAPRSAHYGPQAPAAKIQPEDIADAYWGLHVQRRTGWTWEIDLRPSVEKW